MKFIIFIFTLLLINGAQGSPLLLLRSSPNDLGFNIIPGTDFSNQTPLINDQGHVALLLDKRHLWTWKNNTHEINYSLDGPRFFRLYQYDNTGRALMEILNDDFYSEGLFTINKTQLTEVVSTELDFLNIQFFGNSYLHSDNTITFLAKDGGQKQFLIKKTDQLFKNLVKQSAKDQISYLFTPAFNSNGQVALQVRLGSDPFAANAIDQIRLYQANGTYTLIADSSKDSLQFMSGVSINDKGQIIFLAKDQTHKINLYLWTDDQLELILSSGPPPLSDFDGFKPLINNNSQIVFRGFDGKQRPALFQWQNKQLKILIQEGQTIRTDLGVGQLGQHDLSYPLFSGNIALNNKGEVVFAAGIHPLGNNQIEWGTGLFKTQLIAQ